MKHFLAACFVNVVNCFQTFIQIFKSLNIFKSFKNHIRCNGERFTKERFCTSISDILLDVIYCEYIQGR